MAKRKVTGTTKRSSSTWVKRGKSKPAIFAKTVKGKTQMVAVIKGKEVPIFHGSKAMFTQRKKGSPSDLSLLKRVRSMRGTLEDRIAALEAQVAEHQSKLQFIVITDHIDPTFGHIYGWMFNGVRVGINTSFWMLQDAGEGFPLSQGDDFDRGLYYGEKEGNQRYTGGPTEGMLVFNLAAGAHPNRAIVAGSNGSSENIGVVSYPLLVQDDGNGKQQVFRVEGNQLVGINALFIGHSAADAKQVYP